MPDRQGGADRRGSAADAADRRQPGRTPDRGVRQLREGTASHRAQFFLDVASGPFYGFNRPAAEVSETDFTEDLTMIQAQTLVMHGDDDQIVPIADSAERSIKLRKAGP